METPGSPLQSPSCSERAPFVGTADHVPLSVIGIYSPLLKDQVRPVYGCIILAPLFLFCLDQGSHTNFPYFFSSPSFLSDLGRVLPRSFHRLRSKSLSAGAEPRADGLRSLPTSRAAVFFHRPTLGLLPLVVSSSSWSSAGDNQEGRCHLHRPASVGFLLLLKKKTKKTKKLNSRKYSVKPETKVPAGSLLPPASAVVISGLFTRACVCAAPQSPL